jgi:hypothetical protein
MIMIETAILMTAAVIQTLLLALLLALLHDEQAVRSALCKLVVLVRASSDRVLLPATAVAVLAVHSYCLLLLQQ